MPTRPLTPSEVRENELGLKEPTIRRGRAGGKSHAEIARQQKAYLAGLPKYFTISAALAKAGVAHSTLLYWREHDATFLVREQEARDQLADQLEAEAIRRAFRGIKTPVYQGGLLAGYITQYSDQLLTLMLKALRPEKYRERSEVSVTQPIVKIVAGIDPAEAL